MFALLVWQSWQTYRHPSRKVPHRWPEPSEGSAVLTGLRLGRAGRAHSRSLFVDSTICNVNDPYTQLLTQRAHYALIPTEYGFKQP
jgi:hypothetical protein